MVPATALAALKADANFQAAAAAARGTWVAQNNGLLAGDHPAGGQEHDPLGAIERGEQPIERRGAAREVVPARGAEVKIGEDRGPHRVDGGSSV